MDLNPLPFLAPSELYDQLVTRVLDGHLRGEPDTLRVIHGNHPRFLDSHTPWLPQNLTDSEIQHASFDLEDARLTVARLHGFEDWLALSEYVEAVTADNSPVFLFESAVEAVVNGDLGKLDALLRDHPDLVLARSSRRTHFDPPVHRATLLHYVAANGVEGYRQKTPANAVAIAKALLNAGAETDSLADLYGGQCTTMSLLVSSSHPAQAGVQVALVNLLVDFGASLEARGSGNWTSPLMTALVFGFLDAAEALVRRGAKVDHVAAAAGLGRLDSVAELLPTADAEGRQRAFSLAAQLGHVEAVRILLHAGEDPNRYNLPGSHAHSTPLHQAIARGHNAVVQLLVESGANLSIRDKIYKGTPLGWALHCNQPEIAEYLRTHGAE